MPRGASKLQKVAVGPALGKHLRPVGVIWKPLSKNCSKLPQAEERRSERLGAADDRREEAAEAARQAAKAAARGAARAGDQRR